MSAKRLNKATIAAAAASAVAAQGQAPPGPEVEQMADRIKNDPERRGDLWQGAWQYGAPAIAPLAKLMTDEDFHVARAAKRGIWVIVRHAGRPGADRERLAVVAELLPLMADGQPDVVRREVMWMLSEVAGDEAVEPVMALLTNQKLREDARMVLERIPGQKALMALQHGFNTVPEDFKINIVQSLRARGVKVDGYPCQKMVPTRKTSVKPLE
jgi:hypothetical protein